MWWQRGECRVERAQHAGRQGAESVCWQAGAAAGAPEGAVLLGGEGLAEFLGEEERAAWEAAGKPQAVNASGQGWREDGDVGARYWSVVEEPVYATTADVGTLPVFDANSGGLSLSFWYKPLEPDAEDAGPFMWIGRDRDIQESGFNSWLSGNFVDLYLFADYYADEAYNGEYLSVRNAGGKIEEKFQITSLTGQSQPGAWQHIVMQYVREQRTMSMFLDGELVQDIGEGTHYAPSTALEYAWDVNHFFANATVNLNDNWFGFSKGSPLGKFAQV